MSTTSRRTGSRAIFAAIAAAALLFGMSTPAAADPQDVDGVLTGGHIILGDDKGDPDFEFELGEDPANSTCASDPSTVGGVKESDGTLTDFEFHFEPGDVSTSLGTVCAELEVTNEEDLEGHFDDSDNSIKIPDDKADPTPIVNVEFDHPFLPSGCGIFGVDIGQLTGEANQANDEWTLESDTEDKFEVPASEGCGSASGVIDGLMELPNDGQVLFELDIVKS